MRYKWFLLVVILFIQVSSTWGQQTMNLNPATISPSSYIINIVNPGIGPSAPTVNNTSQSVQYKWAEIWGAPYANLTVQSTSIPLGFTVTVKATGNAGTQNRFGTGDVTVTVGTVEQNLISNIIGTNDRHYGDNSHVSLATRPLVQNILITDFSKLHPGSYPVTITYLLQ